MNPSMWTLLAQILPYYCFCHFKAYAYAYIVVYSSYQGELEYRKVLHGSNREPERRNSFEVQTKVRSLLLFTPTVCVLYQALENARIPLQMATSLPILDRQDGLLSCDCDSVRKKIHPNRRRPSPPLMAPTALDHQALISLPHRLSLCVSVTNIESLTSPVSEHHLTLESSLCPQKHQACVDLLQLFR